MSKPQPPRIALPEGDDERVVAAAQQCAALRIATPVFVTPPCESIDAAELVTLSDDETRKYIAQLKNCYRPKKELSDDEARALLDNPLYRAALLLKNERVDGVVAGAATPTAEVVRAALKIVGLQSGIKTLSSFFLMRLPEQTLLMADCALVVAPTAEQLADIALATTHSAQVFLDEPPTAALLSFSTNGSAAHEEALKIKAVADTLQQTHPDLTIIGEVQADAALNPAIAHRKGIDSERAANVLIFPNLNAGNIAYKLVQQLTNCDAIGPILQGLNKPMNDLSRGATTEDITQVITLTAQQARSH